MFKGIFDTIVNKISNLNPITHFIKYALDKTLNEFLARELTLQDFKNGPLNLNNIEINCNKVNREHLISSPYILHSGVIGYLKISLPPLSQITTKSIQITIQNIEVSLKPNKKFAQNFKEKMFELNQLKKFHVEEKMMDGEISENGPVDFFKQLLKNIIMNIKIQVKNIAVKLYMNTPSSDISHPQFFVLLRIPSIQLKKKEEKQIKKNQVEQMKFNLIIPQISLHLLKEDTKYPDFGNIPYKKGDFPFNYPHIEHPSTLLLIGSPKLHLQQSKNSMKKTSFNFSLLTDYVKKTKQLTMSLEIDSLQVMVTPVQIKILSRFVIQMIEFKNILQNIIEEIKLQTGESIRLSKKKSQQSYHGNNDFFSSLMMSMTSDLAPQGLQRSRSSNNQDLFQSIINQNKTIKRDVDKFNEECAKKIRDTIKMSKEFSVAASLQQFQAIDFKNIINFNAQLGKLKIFILKYSPILDFKRKWSVDKDKDRTQNQSIGCSHFLMIIEKAQFHQKVNEKIIDANFKSIKVYNIKLKEQIESSIDDYHDINQSVVFYSMNANVADPSQFVRNQPDLLDFKLKQTSHYCTQQIMKINQDEEQDKNISPHKKTYCMLPKFDNHKSDAYILYKPGFSFHFDKKQNYIKINMEIITISVNMQILEDLLNIVYPIFMYRRISDLISFKREQLNITKSSKKSLFQSQYQFRIDMMKMQDMQEGSSSKKDIIVLQILQVKLGFRKGKSFEEFSDLTKKNKEKIYDEDSFSKVCFCKTCEQQCLYAQIFGIQLKKKSMIKFSCKKVEAGLFKLNNSQIKSVSSLIRLNSHRQEDGLRVFVENINCLLLTIFVPGLNFRITEDMLAPIFNMIKNNLYVIHYLMAYRHFLEGQMAMIQQYSTQIFRKNKKNQNKEIELKLFVDKIFVECEFGLLKADKIFFTKYNDGILLKISTFVLGLKRDMRAKLCQFRNELMLLSQYPRAMRHYQIPDSDVILEIFDTAKNNLTFKSMQKQAFFQKLSKQAFSINFSLVKKETDRCNQKANMSKFKKESSRGSNNTFSQKFKFKQLSSTIEEEGERFLMNLQLTKNIHIYLCNALQLIRFKDRVIKITQFIKNQNQSIKDIKSKTLIMQRKNSTEIERESIEINLKFSEVLVDIRPDFTKKQNEKIFGQTRSILCLDLGETLISINQQKNSKQITTNFHANYYFLRSDDREISLNPILLMEDTNDFSSLGFKAILQLSRTNVTFRNVNNRNIVSLKIGNILGQASLKTLAYLQLHMEHFINHHVKGQIGMSLQQMYENQQYCVLLEQDANEDLSQNLMVIQNLEDDFIVEDLTEALIEYEQKLNLKVNDEKQLKQRVFHPNYISNSFVCIESFVIEKMTIRLSCCDDFDFIKLIQLGSSICQKRSRNKENQEQRYLTISLNGLHVIADIDSSLELSNPARNKQLDIINSFITIQKIKITMSKQKFSGHSSLRLIEDHIQHQAFTLLSNESEMCLIFEKNPKKILFKTYSIKVKVGATSQIVNLIKYWKNSVKDIEKEGWKKIYENSEKKNKKQNKQTSDTKILALFPESYIKLSLQYQGIMSILDEQKIITTELLLNQELSNEYALKKKVRKWAKQIVKDNLGSLISRTALNLLIKLISQIIALNVTYIGKLLGLFFGNSE